MSEKFRCITNNPIFKEKGFSPFEYYDVNNLELYRIVKKEILSGSRLLSHPLTGSIRPDITPYKTVLLSSDKSGPDSHSVLLIEKAICYTINLYGLRKIPLYKKWDSRTKEDFQFVDYSIIIQALEIAGIKNQI